MNNYDFLDILIGNLYNYYLVLILVIVVYIFMFKKLYISILDPLVISIIGSIFGFSVVLFLYLEAEISNYYFLSYLLTQFSYLFSMLYFSNYKIHIKYKVIKLPDSNRLNFTIYIISSILFVVSQVILYKSFGIPLFMDSRLEVFIEGDGSGILARFIDVSSFISLYLIFDIFLNKKTKSIPLKLYSYLIIIFFVTSAILSGSKSSFLSLAYALFVFVVINPSLLIKNISALSILKKNEFKVILIGLSSAILITTIQSKDGIGESLLVFVYRLVGYGDVYWYAYPEGSLEQLNGNSPFYALFTDALGLTRLVSWDQLPTALGIDLYEMFHSTDIIVGPNARHNVFGYVYFGFFGSIFFSGILGMLVGSIRRKLFSIENHTSISKIFVALIYSRIFTLETDPMLALTYLNSIFIVYSIIIIIALILSNTKSEIYE